MKRVSRLESHQKTGIHTRKVLCQLADLSAVICLPVEGSHGIGRQRLRIFAPLNAADIAIRAVHRVWQGVAHADDSDAELAGNPPAWMGSPRYMRVAQQAMERRVREPLRARGIPLMA